MRTDRLELAHRLSSLLVPLLLIACGGGGGGGGGGGSAPLVYAGNTNSAVITALNASRLVADIFGSADTANAVAGFSIEGSSAARDSSGGLAGQARRLSRSFGDTLAHVERVNSGQGAILGVIPIDDTNPCDSGSVHIIGTLNDYGTGTLNVSYDSCRFGDETISGPATFRVDAFDMGFMALTDYTINFPVLTFRRTGVSIDSGGILRVQSNIGTRTETITENIVSRDNVAQSMTKAENLVLVNVYDNIFAPSSFTGTVMGRVFDSVHGYVDVTTLAPVGFGTLTQVFPGSGQVLLTGNANRRTRVTALSTALARLDLDLDGNGVFENSATLKWTDLSGPVGADLRDTDGDGMHDSWETANHLNPAVADGALDPDGDGFTNLAEYRGGGDPGSATSIPSMLVSPVFPVASDIVVANSDTEKPGKSGVAFDGANYLLVSCRDVAPDVGPLGVTLSGSGQVLNSFPIPGASCPQRPAVAFDGANYLVLLSQGGQIVGTWVTPAGTVLPGGLAVSTSGTSNFNAAVAFNGTDYLVVWMKYISTNYWIYGAKVTPAGVVSSEFAISSGNGDQFPAIASDGANFLVVWTQVGVDPGDVFGARVTAAGTVQDSPAFAIATLAGSQSATGLAFDGTIYLVVWDHQLTTGVFPPPDGKIYGRRIATSGALLDGAANSDGIAISTGAFANHSSSVAFAGSHYVVAWAAGSFPNFPPAGIYAARIAKSGSRIDGLPGELGVPISGAPPSASRFVYPVAASGGQDALISWANNIELSVAFKDILGVSVSGF